MRTGLALTNQAYLLLPGAYGGTKRKVGEGSVRKA